MAGWVDGFVEGGVVRLAVRSCGDQGSPVLLLHGAGCSLSYWGAMLPDLAARHRVVAMDIRGHGRSGEGPWDVAALLSDIEAVRREHGLGGGAIVGHSMGAVLAHLFAEAHADVRAVVNLDGFSLRPSEYVGLDADVAAERRRRHDAEDDRPESHSAEEIAERVTASVAQYGLNAELAREIVHSGVRMDAGGRYVSRVSDETGRGIRAFYDGYMGERSLFDLVGSARCRSLVFRATTHSFDGLEDWQRELFAAYFAGVEQGLSRVAAAPRVRVRPVEASHGLIFEQPALLAQEIREFLAEV